MKSTTLRYLRADLRYLMRYRPRSRWNWIEAALTNRGFHALLLYRLSHALWNRRVPILPLILTRLGQFLFAVDISPQARLGPAIVIVHGFGLVIGSKVVIEGECALFHGVTLGDRSFKWLRPERQEGHPYVGRNTMFSAGCKVLGPITIGSHSVVGANAVVIESVPEGCVAGGVPARILRQRPAEHCLSYWDYWLQD
jgi:serine O-acetyltransferase